jgi:hypothetical protein
MEPLPALTDSRIRAQRILAVAAIIHIVLFALEARGTFVSLANPQPVTMPDRLGPFLKGADSVGYYVWLRSPLIDGDFDFDNDFAPMFTRSPEAEPAFPHTETGLRTNPWPVGPAILWAPAVCGVHVVLIGLGESSPWPADGFSAPYQLAVGLTTLALSLLTLLLAYRICRRFAGPVASAAATALITLATPFVGYGAVEVSMSHGPATAVLLVFVFVWLRSLGSTSPGRWAGLGCLFGLTCLMRWQLSTFVVLPVLEAAWLASRAENWSARLKIAASLVLAGVMTAIVFTPQLAAKQLLFGHPLGGLHKTGSNWLDPALWTVLFSTDRGLFYWTPITLPSFMGLVYLACRSRRPAAAILATAVAIQFYSVAALLGPGVFLGWAFGFRILTETCVLLAPGLAILFERFGRSARWLAVGGGWLAGWNLVLLGAFRRCMKGVDGCGPLEMCDLVRRSILHHPIEAIGMVIAAAWLTSTLLAAFPRRPAAAAPVAPETHPQRAAA